MGTCLLRRNFASQSAESAGFYRLSISFTASTIGLISPDGLATGAGGAPLIIGILGHSKEKRWAASRKDSRISSARKSTFAFVQSAGNGCLPYLWSPFTLIM